jgi:putative heme-binding domain-containing protein
MVGVPSSESGMFLLNYITQYALPTNNLRIVFQHIARFIPYEQLDKAVNIALQKKGNDIDVEFQIFKGLQQGIAQRGAKENAQLVQWGKELAGSLLDKYLAGNPLEKSQDVLLRQTFAVELAGNYKVRPLESKIRAFVEDSTNLDIKDPDWDTFIKIRTALDLKTAALRSLLRLAPEKNAALAGTLLQDEATSLEFRKRVATVLGEFPGPAVEKALGAVKNVPSDLQAVIVMSLANSSEGKNIIFRKVRKGEIFPRTLIEPTVEERILLNISDSQQKEFEALTAHLEPVSKEKQALINTRLLAFNASSKQPPSVESGQKVFAQQCATCHKIGNEGGMIGPNLDGVGEWGPEALAEKILDPNRNISEAFRNYTIQLKDGKVMTGLYRREEGEVIIFADVTGQEFSVPRKDIAEQKASRYTLMPDHFGKILSQEEFNALLTYLLHQKN